MNDLLGVTVDDLVASLKSRRLRIPAEIGAFVALETTEALMRGPAAVRGGDVRIAEDGTIAVFAPPHSASAEDAARAVCSMLASLLVAAGTGVPTMLIGLVERGPSGGAAALERLRDELESALVPLNRAAARRVLSRMIREARRASIRPEARLDEVPEDRLDAALDDLLGPGAGGASDPDLSPPAFDSAPAAALSDPFADPKRDAHPVSIAAPAKLDAALDELFDAPARIPPAPRVPTDLAPAREPPRTPEPDRDPEPEPQKPAPRPVEPRAPRPPSELDELERLPAAPRSGGGVVWALAFLLLAALTVAGVAVLRPDLIDRALGRETAPEAAPAGPTPEEREAAARAHRARFGTLTVRSTPDRAQVLMLIGRGPAVARELPTGMAYELVAIADGRAPTRAVVPADATWESTPDGPRYELGMQTGDVPMQADALVLGETRLPRDALGAPSATLGSVRVVTTPPAAKVYLLVGFTPQVQVQNVRTDEIVELLVYLEGHRVERVLVAPSDWVAGEDGGRAADVAVTLTPTRPTRIR